MSNNSAGCPMNCPTNEKTRRSKTVGVSDGRVSLAPVYQLGRLHLRSPTHIPRRFSTSWNALTCLAPVRDGEMVHMCTCRHLPFVTQALYSGVMTTLNESEWRAQREVELTQLTEAANALLVDRAVVHVVAVPHDDDCDSPNVLRLTLDDGSVIDISGGYGGYSGHSCDEYVELISIDRVPV